jgi:Outer membrane protein
MIKKFSAVLCLFLLCAAALPAQTYRIKYSADDKDPISLENAIRLALENDYDLLLTEQDVVIAEQRLKEAKFLYLPQISVNAGATSYDLDYPTVLPENLGLRLISPKTPNQNDSDLFYGVGVLAMQYLYTGGRTSSTVSMANAALKEAMSRYEGVKSSIIYKVKESFFNYMFLQHKKELIDNVVARAQKITAGGNTSRLDNIIEQTQLAYFTSEQNETGEDFTSARLKLLKTLNKELNAKVVVEDDFEFKPIDVDLSKVTLWSMEYRPELKSALYKLEMDTIAVKLSLAKRYPDIMLGASYDKVGTDNLKDKNFQATLALKLPIGYDYNTQVKQKRAEQRQTVLKRAAIEDGIRMQVTEAYDNLMFWQKETAARVQTWDSVNKEFKALDFQKLSKEEKLKALEYYYKAGVGYLEGIKQHMLAVAQLELAVGQDIR